MLEAIDALRNQVKQSKEAIYATGAAEDRTGKAADLRELQSQLDDLWHAVYTGAIDKPAATRELDALFRKYLSIASGTKADE